MANSPAGGSVISPALRVVGTYGGATAFVVAFAILPIGIELFRSVALPVAALIAVVLLGAGSGSSGPGEEHAPRLGECAAESA